VRETRGDSTRPRSYLYAKSDLLTTLFGCAAEHESVYRRYPVELALM
jgi:hypothetical protein